MAFADTQKLIVELSLGGNFMRQIGAAQKAVGSFDARLSKTEGRAFRAGQQIGTGILNGAKIAAVGIAALSSQVVFGLRQLSQLEDLTAQTNAVIKSTGGAAQETAADIRHLAEKYENLNAVIDDKVIQSGENLLLTFTNIRHDAFEPTLQAALDMSTALGQDLNTSVLQLGKALSDPAKGLLALRRAGVIFSKDQEKRIKALQKEGKLFDAQKIILAEVGREFGGSFAAQGKTATGTIAGIGDAVEDLQKALATALFPTIQKVLPKIRDFLLSPELQSGITELGKGIAGLFSDENIAAGVDILKSVFQTAKAAAPVVAAAAKTMAGIVSTAVGVFKSLPPEIQQLAVGAFAINKLTGGLVTNIAGGLISSVLKQLVSGVVNVNGGVVNVNGAVGGGGGLPGAAAQAAGGVGLAAAGAAGIGAVIIGGLQGLGASIAGQIAGPIAEAVQKNVGGGPTNVFAPISRLIDALNGDLRSPLEKIEGNTEKAIGRYDPQWAASAQRQNVTNERLEAIRGQQAAAAAKAVGDSQSERVAISNAAAQAAAKQQAIVNAAASTASAVRQTDARQVLRERLAAVQQKIADGTSETRAVAAAVRAKKLSVTTNVNVVSKVSVQNVIKSSTKYKSVYNVAQ